MFGRKKDLDHRKHVVITVGVTVKESYGGLDNEGLQILMKAVADRVMECGIFEPVVGGNIGQHCHHDCEEGGICDRLNVQERKGLEKLQKELKKRGGGLVNAQR